MAEGSPRIIFRLPSNELDELHATIQKANYRRTEEPYDLSSFIRSAIREKIAKMARSRKKRVRPNRTHQQGRTRE